MKRAANRGLVVLASVAFATILPFNLGAFQSGSGKAKQPAQRVPNWATRR